MDAHLSHKVITLNNYPHYQPANTGTDHLSWLGTKSFTEVHNRTKWHVDDVQEVPQGHFVEDQNCIGQSSPSICGIVSWQSWSSRGTES